ncbi:hypothetical protein QJS66_04770 [Kocuria rhizophila]|nr:hypothetical protein QJS66_04770 [Kocuria rhizophila]
MSLRPRGARQRPQSVGGAARADAGRAPAAAPPGGGGAADAADGDRLNDERRGPEDLKQLDAGGSWSSGRGSDFLIGQRLGHREHLGPDLGVVELRRWRCTASSPRPRVSRGLRHRPPVLRAQAAQPGADFSTLRQAVLAGTPPGGAPSTTWWESSARPGPSSWASAGCCPGLRAPRVRGPTGTPWPWWLGRWLAGGSRLGGRGQSMRLTGTARS